MKQKIVIRLNAGDDKSRRKALKTAVGRAGVESATLQGQEKNQIEVVGDGIDAVELTASLRKNVGYADLLTVNPVDEKKDGGGEEKQTAENKNQATMQPPIIWYPVHQPPYYEYGVINNEPSCNIM